MGILGGHSIRELVEAGEKTGNVDTLFEALSVTISAKLPEQGLPGSDVDETPTQFITTRDLTGIDSSGREFAIKLSIGAPY